MDVSSIVNLATNMSQQATDTTLGISVLKKALDMEKSSAAQLIAAIPDASNLPDNLGQNINVSA
jgi:hypothetical protein